MQTTEGACLSEGAVARVFQVPAAPRWVNDDAPEEE